MTERLIELGLHETERNDQQQTDNYSNSDLTVFNARLLNLISDTAIESGTLRTTDFRARLEYYRQLLENSPDGDPHVGILANDCLRLCQDYLTRARTYLLEREGEFTQVIEVMRVALGKLAGDANAFNVRLIGTSERFNRLTEIQDIRELKKRICQEVNDLNRAVREKQKQDEMQYAKLSRRIEVLQENLTQSKQEASLDSLTRISNRRTFDDALARWVAAHKENQKTFSLALLDIDNFKQINDTHGHQVGDRVLFCAAQWLAKYVRSTDILARYGGEEFVVLLADVALSQAEVKFTDLLVNMSGCNYAYKKDEEECSVVFTASCGLAEFKIEETGEDLLRRADEALYIAKRTGKNRVVVAKSERSLWKSLTSRGVPRPKQKS
jgi:diguanylate cyclase